MRRLPLRHDNERGPCWRIPRDLLRLLLITVALLTLIAHAVTARASADLDEEGQTAADSGRICLVLDLTNWPFPP